MIVVLNSLRDPNTHKTSEEMNPGEALDWIKANRFDAMKIVLHGPREHVASLERMINESARDIYAEMV